MANRYKTGSAPKQKPGKGGRWIVIIILLICELFVYTTIRLESIHTKHEIDRAETETSKLASRTTALIVEKERLGSPERITKIAKSRLNMSMPASDQVIYIEQHELYGKRQ